MFLSALAPAFSKHLAPCFFRGHFGAVQRRQNGAVEIFSGLKPLKSGTGQECAQGAAINAGWRWAQPLPVRHEHAKAVTADSPAL